MLIKILIAILGVVLIWFLAGPKAARFTATSLLVVGLFLLLFPGAQSDLFRITKMSTVELILQGLLGLGIILILLPIMKKLLVFIVDNFKY